MARANKAIKNTSSVNVGFEAHDHTACVQTALQAAEAHCLAKELRFTPVRRRTLEILLQEHRALGAYDLLKSLSASGFGSQPPVAYRAIDFLVKNGFAHKVEKLNAFIACNHPGASHSPAFMICRSCDVVVEGMSGPARGMIGKAANEVGFKIEKSIIEVEGICGSCAEQASA